MTLCPFCLDERGPCAHPECPFGASEPLVPGLAGAHPARPATRPSILGGPAAEAVPSPVHAARLRPPHIATAPSVVDADERGDRS